MENQYMSFKEKLSARISRRELIKPVSAGLFGFAFLNLFKEPVSAQNTDPEEEFAAPGDLPPIIIKSGSLVIESDEPLTKSGNNYKRAGFNLIQSVRIIKINEYTGATQTFTFADPKGVEVDFRLQHFVSNNWQPIDQSPLVQIKNENAAGSADFVLISAKELEKRGKSKPRRKERRQDKGNDVFRFAGIVIRGRGTASPPVIPPTVEGDEYVIGLYNSYVRKNPDSKASQTN
jgi:hypothetical protein